jgi:hypothetical protein
MPGVDMTSGVKGYFVSQSVDGLLSWLSSDLNPDQWKRRSQASRRLITLISVGWVLPYLRPSGACLDLGSRVSCSRLPPTRIAPHRGCVPSNGLSVPPSRVKRAMGTSRAMAPMQAAISRVIATTTWLACFPRAVKCRKRLHKRTWAFQPTGWMACGHCANRHGRWRLTLAG